MTQNSSLDHCKLNLFPQFSANQLFWELFGAGYLLVVSAKLTGLHFGALSQPKRFKSMDVIIAALHRCETMKPDWFWNWTSIYNASASKDHTSLCNDLGAFLLFGHCSLSAFLRCWSCTPEIVGVHQGVDPHHLNSRGKPLEVHKSNVQTRGVSPLQSVRTFSLQVWHLAQVELNDKNVYCQIFMVVM